MARFGFTRGGAAAAMVAAVGALPRIASATDYLVHNAAEITSAQTLAQPARLDRHG
jgi:hypothetical protein